MRRIFIYILNVIPAVHAVYYVVFIYIYDLVWYIFIITLMTTNLYRT